MHQRNELHNEIIEWMEHRQSWFSADDIAHFFVIDVSEVQKGLSHLEKIGVVSCMSDRYRFNRFNKDKA